MSGVVTLTLNPAVDAFALADEVAPDVKIRCRDMRREPGGGGINVARVLTRLGLPARAVYASGGSAGGLLTRLLREEGVDCRPVEVAGETRTNVSVLAEARGDLYRFGMPGCSLGGEDLRACLDALFEDGTPAWVVASGSLPPGAPDDAYAILARRCRDVGSRLVLDTSGEPLRKAVQEGVFAVKPNLRELTTLLGKEFEHEEQYRELAARLDAQGLVKLVVISLGAAGAYFRGLGEEGRVSPPTVRIRSTVGAGDSMVAGLVRSLAEGAGAAEAVRYAVACGAATVSTDGSELCRPEDVERLYRSISER